MLRLGGCLSELTRCTMLNSLGLGHLENGLVLFVDPLGLGGPQGTFELLVAAVGVRALDKGWRFAALLLNCHRLVVGCPLHTRSTGGPTLILIVIDLLIL